MKQLALISLSLLVVNCGTVVGNGRSGSDKSRAPAYQDKANAGTNTGAAGDTGNNTPPANPESASATNLLGYFLVSCASPFATASEGNYRSTSGTIEVEAGPGLRELSGMIEARIVLAAEVGSPYAIEELSQASKVDCKTTVETPRTDGTTDVVVTFSDSVSIEWTFDSNKLLSFKAVSADGVQSIEYLLDEDE